MRHKILIADDHVMVAEGLASLLREEYTLVGIAADGRALLDLAATTRPDVIITDMAMPVLDGLEALRRLRHQQIDCKVIFLTMHGDPAMAGEALRQGAHGFILKTSAGEELLVALRQVLRGGVYVSSQIAHDAIRMMAIAPNDKLTPRQRDVLRWLATGLSAKEIASELNLSARTVETYKYELMQNLQLHSTAALVRYAIRKGLVAC